MYECVCVRSGGDSAAWLGSTIILFSLWRGDTQENPLLSLLEIVQLLGSEKLERRALSVECSEADDDHAANQHPISISADKNKTVKPWTLFLTIGIEEAIRVVRKNPISLDSTDSLY